MARIIKTLSGKWQAHVCVKRIRKTRSFKTKAQAQEWVRDMEHKLARGDAGASYVHTLGDVLKRYQKEVSEHKKRRPVGNRPHQQIVAGSAIGN